MGKLEGVTPLASASAYHRKSMKASRSLSGCGMTLILSAGLLAGLATASEAAPRRFYVSNSSWFGLPSLVQPRFTTPYYYPKKRKIRSNAGSKRHKAEPITSFGEMPKGPLQIVVSISSQRVTLFSNGERVAQGPVSTGTASHPTPLGVFSILQKNRHHRSNLYSNAPMPYMQRLTWSGVALHEGVLPGYPASHGCIRLSRDFAAKLWPATRLGARVIVARNELAPIEFKHAKLFGPKPKPGEPPVAMNPPTDGMSASRPVMLAQAPSADTERSASDAATTDETAVKPPVKPETTSLPQPATTEVPVNATSVVETGQPPNAATLVPGELRKSVELDPSEPSSGLAEAVPVSVPPPLVETAASDDGPEKPAPTIDPAKPFAPRARSADQWVKRTGQIAVFVSRREQKVFVRQGFIPVLDLPVVIEEPDQPLGTHVFTAMGANDNGAGMRWNLFTIPTDGVPTNPSTSRKSKTPPKLPVLLKAPSTAAEALDRIQMPKEAVDRISELLVPGSSLVISDEGLGRETGRYTEFIVLTR